MSDRIPPSLAWLVRRRKAVAGQLANVEKRLTAQLNEAAAAMKEIRRVAELERKSLRQDLGALDRSIGLHEIRVNPQKLGRTQIQSNPRSTGYRSIGLHKRSRYVGGVLSRHTLEQGLFRLSESPEQTRPLADVLVALGFTDSLRLVYRESISWAGISRKDTVNDLRRYLDSINDNQNGVPTGIKRELLSTTSQELAELMAQALQLIEEHRQGRDLNFEFSFSKGRPSEDYAILQSIALLRRLRVLTLRECQLTLPEGPSIDLASASSGQQQMLCSVFGLVGELRSNSLVLIDEPELSLHPNWQMTLLDRLRVVFSQFNGCHVLIATHSPIIVQKALESRFNVLQLGHQSMAYEPDMAREVGGHQISVEGTLLDVFDTPITGSVYLANEIFNIVTAGEGEDDAAKQGAIARLQALRELYQHAGPQDLQTLALIDDAIALVNEPDDDGEPDNA